MGLQRAILDLAYCMHRDMDEKRPRHAVQRGVAEQNPSRSEKVAASRTKCWIRNFFPLSRWGRVASCNTIDHWQGCRLKRKGWEWAFFIGSLGFLAAAIAGTHAPLFTAIALVSRLWDYPLHGRESQESVADLSCFV